MLRNLILLLMVFVQVLYVNAQKTIIGKVIDDTDQQPLIGTFVQLKSGKNSTVTDELGNFEIKGSNGEDHVIIKYLGYNEIQIEINDQTSDIGTIKLERANTTLDEVIVSASPNNYKGDFKGSNFRINPVTLKNINPLSTEEILRTVPGVNIIGDMGLSNRPNISIRGSWGRRSKKVLLMEDGTPSAPAPYIAPGAYYNPVSDRLTAIEVYKGADMLRFGPNNMYGAINYITAMPPQKPELRIKLVGGERNYQTGLLSYGGTWNNLGALVESVYKKFDGFTNNSSVEILNLNAKIFAKLSENQSLYFKVSGQFEDNQASLSSQTPFTFDTDPTQNPLDADQFTMRRYGVDIIHKWLPNNNLSFTSKMYATDFERDWWRQVTAKVKASEVRNYLGENIFNDRYSYLNGKTFGEEDYVIVGRVVNGQESTTDSRWTYTVSGFKETMDYDWQAFGEVQHLEASINFHRETFKDRFLVANNSRWARSGTTTTDLWYRLWSANGFIRNEFNIGKWGITPILRVEHVDMYRQDLLALAQNPNINSTKEGREPNVYTQFLPGITLDYRIANGEFYGSIYQGMIAPSKVFGFLVEQDGIVTNPLAGQSINIEPELAWNREIGWRGNLWNNRIDGQLTYFNNTSRNFYAGGRNEVFEKLGKINVEGLEVAIGADLFNINHHKLRLFGNINIMQSKVLEGILVDKDLFSQVIHSTNTQNEYLDKVNTNRNAYDVYVSDGLGNEVLLTNETIDQSNFQNITKSVIKFGDNGVSDADAPYTPKWNTSMGFNYDFNKLSVGVSGHFVSEQFTEFHNFRNESADGAIGKLPAYHSIDTFVNYDFVLGKNLNTTVFINGKNITNEIYRASRLNRATSGVFGGGFRQIIFGVNIKI
ncbi:TonB-dependent receptor [Arenibacter sp. GZD96]|uniref:carboxypeptidase-like regulatory domain-containing protein n=1 Tax=Aurantibrevibacter litoralis TaxID=3106030 RepID=UPI002AFE70E4|nr:carboxypeptidase-like regulatory domain-containing protein [Arenibacter sp. GZD-96]MEA1787559.1 TonB-dependent receptor [Arenibacter sp. GZD-96]